MRHHLAIAGVFLALAACSPKTEAPQNEGADAGGAAPGAVAEKRMPLPDCAEVEAKDKGVEGWRHEDCRMMLKDQSGRMVEVRWPSEPANPSDAATHLTVQIVGPGDATLQTIHEDVGSTFAGPSLLDINGDGAEELLIPLETGNVNTSYAIWTPSKGSEPFARAGEATGYDFSQSGEYVLAMSRSAANIQNVSFLKMDGETLVPIATAEVTATGAPEKITGIECAVKDDGGLSKVGLSLKQAQTQFCADPKVKTIFD